MVTKQSKLLFSFTSVKVTNDYKTLLKSKVIINSLVVIYNLKFYKKNVYEKRYTFLYSIQYIVILIKDLFICM